MTHQGRSFHELTLLRKDMLTRRDFRYNFYIFKLASALRIIPLDCDAKHGIFKVPRSPWKRGLSLGICGITIVHLGYMVFRLLQVLLGLQESLRHHLVLHADITLAGVIVEGWYLSCFVLYPETFVALFNSLFTGRNTCDGTQGSLRKARSRQEWLALAMPVSISLTVSFIAWLYTYDSSMVFLLYSALSENYKTSFWFRLLLCQEIVLVTFVGSNGILVLVAQLLFIENINGNLKALNPPSGLMWTEDMAEGAYDQLRKIQYQLILFNRVNRFIAFSFKLYCIAMCTLNGYFMIAYFSTDPIFGCMYYVVFGVLCTLYSIMYEKAFAIPKMVRLAKFNMLLKVRAGESGPGFTRKMKMRLQSVPEVGIEVGHFNTFERVATPLFMDYVLRNVMGLLAMHLNN